MYAVAYSILCNPQDAEDAVHHAFVKIIENISKISDLECPKTASYIVTIVEHTAINLYRKKMPTPMLSRMMPQASGWNIVGEMSWLGVWQLCRLTTVRCC